MADNADPTASKPTNMQVPQHLALLAPVLRIGFGVLVVVAVLMTISSSQTRSVPLHPVDAEVVAKSVFNGAYHDDEPRPAPTRAPTPSWLSINLSTEASAASLLGLNLTQSEQEEVSSHHSRIRGLLHANKEHYADKRIFADFKAKIQACTDKYMAENNQSSSVQTHIALLKTHRTAAATLAEILSRFAARKHLRVFQAGISSVMRKGFILTWKQVLTPAQRGGFDMVLQHVSSDTPLMCPFPDVMAFFQYVIADPVTITIFREPIEHALAWACYVKAPQSISELSHLIQTTLPSDILAADFALKNPADVNDFFKRDARQFSLLCLSEALEECLVMLRRKFNWTVQDIMFLYATRKPATVRWDGKKLMIPPSFDELPAAAQTALMSKTKLGHMMYAHAREAWQVLISKQDVSFFEELEDFQALLRQFQDLCDTHAAHPVCVWHSLDDLSYNRLVKDVFIDSVEFD